MKPKGYDTFPGKQKMSFVALYTLEKEDRMAITKVRTFIYSHIQSKMRKKGYTGYTVETGDHFVTIFFTNVRNDTFCSYRVHKHMYGIGVLTLHMTLFDTSEILRARFHHKLIDFIRWQIDEDNWWYTKLQNREAFTQHVLQYMQGCYMPLLAPLYNICDRCALCLSINFKYKCKYYSGPNYVDASL